MTIRKCTCDFRLRWRRWEVNVAAAGFGRRYTRSALATLLAFFDVVEAVRVTLATAVVERVAVISSSVVVPLPEESVARTHHARENAHICHPTVTLIIVSL